MTAIRIAWAEPYARQYAVQYLDRREPHQKAHAGVWQTFPGGSVDERERAEASVQLATEPVSVQWVRILMTESSNTCDTHGAADKRNCAGLRDPRAVSRHDDERMENFTT